MDKENKKQDNKILDSRVNLISDCSSCSFFRDIISSKLNKDYNNFCLTKLHEVTRYERRY